MKKYIKKIIRWAFAEEVGVMNERLESIQKLQSELQGVVKTMEVCVDVHEYGPSPSWAVISIQGQKADYIKFVDLGRAEVLEIAKFISQFDRRKVDATPTASHFLRITK